MAWIQPFHGDECAPDERRIADVEKMVLPDAEIVQNFGKDVSGKDR